MSMDDRAAQSDLRSTLQYARERNYAGYSKFDGLESPLMRALTLGTRYGRLFWQQAVKYSTPFNIRPLLGVRKVRNPKGIALFARASLVAGALWQDEALLKEGKALLDWLLEHNSQYFLGQNKPYAGKCWGYNFHWQGVGFEAPAYMPNTIVTSFCAEAMVTGYTVLKDQRYLDAAQSACQFMTTDLPVLFDENDMLCVGYVPAKCFKVVNINAVSGALMAKVSRLTGDASLLERARRQLNFVRSVKTDYGAWYYTHPAGDSPISHDNYHTGGVCDGILEYQLASGDTRFDDMLQEGLSFYRKHLFEADGAPRWMNDRQYPYDVHGSAQGMLTFAKIKDFELAGRIAMWAHDHLKRPDGAYRYQIGRNWLTTRNYTLMRWCNAWMSWAHASFCAMKAGRPDLVLPVDPT